MYACVKTSSSWCMSRKQPPISAVQSCSRVHHTSLTSVVELRTLGRVLRRLHLPQSSPATVHATDLTPPGIQYKPRFSPFPLPFGAGNSILH